MFNKVNRFSSCLSAILKGEEALGTRSNSQASPMLSFPVVFVSSARESDRNRINMAKNKLLMTFLDGKGVCLIFIGKKIESHYFL